MSVPGRGAPHLPVRRAHRASTFNGSPTGPNTLEQLPSAYKQVTGGVGHDLSTSLQTFWFCSRGDVKIPTYKPHTNHKRSSVSSHILAQTTICDLSHSVCRSPLTDLGHISSVTYVCHPLWFVCGHRKGILTSPLTNFLFLFYIH